MQIKLSIQHAIFLFISIISAYLVFNSCSQMSEIMKAVNIKQPKAEIKDVRISGLSIEQADLEFDIMISNPNSIGIDLSGFDYDLLLNKNSFLKGNQQKPVKIAANDSSVVKLPLTLSYADIYETYKSLINEDNIQYILKTGLKFNLPVLGATRIPLETSGSVPTIKLPSISLKSLKIKNLGITSAQLQLDLAVDNPNAFSLDLSKFNYDFQVAGQKWVTGRLKKNIGVAKKGQSAISVPISLNFLEMGQSVLNLISGGTKLDYKLSGAADVSTSLALLKSYPFNFDYTGKIGIKQ